MNTTQQHLSISDIADDILILKNGGGAMVLEVAAVNFGLLSDREQIAIIASFAQMLNSLSFSIQIMILSQRLNISSYLLLLDKAQKAQTNQLLSGLISEYRQFIQSTIKDNEVLDKKFYLVIPLYALELGLTASKEHLQQKVKTILLPRRDQIFRQLARIGLRAKQLDKKELVELVYNIYNGEMVENTVSQPLNPAELSVSLKNPQPVTKSTWEESPSTSLGTSKPTSQVFPVTATPAQAQPQTAAQPPIQPGQTARTHPFVVEELE